MGKAWEKDGKSQGMPTLHPCNGYEGWAKHGRKMGEARESPSFAHETSMKDGQKVAKDEQVMEKTKRY